MKLNVDKILQQAGCSEKEFADEVKISQNELREYKDGKEKMSAELLAKIVDYTGLSPKALQLEDQYSVSAACSVDPIDTWAPSKMAKNNLVEYIRQGLISIHSDTVQVEIKKIEQCLSNLKKPKIAFAGQSDTGKSTLINALLGAERMPAKWTPTTSIVVYIKHPSDRPTFITDNVWIFGKRDNRDWDEKMLDNETYCKNFFLAGGDYPILETYGTHQSESEENKEAFSAVAFIDSPLLKDCDILDLPGFAASSEDDALHKFNTQDNVTDILIYMSRSNGFLQDRDLDYLNHCITALRPAEKKGGNDIGKLENLFIIASQAGAVNGGNNSELQDILNRRCHALCEPFKAVMNESTLLPLRSKLTGYDYKEEDLRTRFYTYEKDLPRLCKKFVTDFTTLAEKLPKAIHNDFCCNLKDMIQDSVGIITLKIDEYKSMMANREQYLELVRDIKEKEPARKVQQQQKNKEMLVAVDTLKTNSKQEFQSIYTNKMTEETLVALIEAHGYKNKKSDKQEFATMVSTVLSEAVQNLLMQKSDDYAQRLTEYLSDYRSSFSEYASSDGIRVKFDTTNSFALGLVSLGALGASAAWLATSLTAWSVAFFGPLAGWGSVLAVGGVIGIAIGAVIAGAIAIAKAFTWKKDLAKSIIKTYEKEEYISKIFQQIETYWCDTKDSFTTAADRVEADWKKKIEEYNDLADEESLTKLKDKLLSANQGLAFFMKIPVPEHG